MSFTTGDGPDPAVPILQLLTDSVRRHADAIALRFRRGGRIVVWTYRELWERSGNLTRGLIASGVDAGDRVAMQSENRPEWAVMDLAILRCGAATVPIYPSLPASQVAYIVRDSGAKLLVASDRDQVAKGAAVRAEVPGLQGIIAFEPNAAAPPDVVSLDELVRRGETIAAERLVARESEVGCETLASIIYTSGTTGQMKGAMLTHANFGSNVAAAFTILNISEKDEFLSFLPLSHVFERMAGHFLPLAAGATINYCGGLRQFAGDLRTFAPTIMCGVPRLYESLLTKITDGIAAQPARRRRLAEWALSVGRAWSNRLTTERRPGIVLMLRRAVADRLVLRRLREQLGGRVWFLLAGGARLEPETALFFHAIGITILEGYGLTETSPVIAVNRPARPRFGTVGPPLPGVEVRIAADGEILTRGPHVMRGYLNLPEATAEAIDGDGWFHTGDIGQIEEDGCLRITDRKKNIIVLSNGKNVAPARVESIAKRCPAIAEVLVVGDGRSTISALLVPDSAALEGFVRSHGLPGSGPQDWVQLEQVTRFYRRELDAVSGELADFETIKRFTLLPRPFSQDAGELTPTLKLKRQVILEHYRDEIDSLYR